MDQCNRKGSAIQHVGSFTGFRQSSHMPGYVNIGHLSPNSALALYAMGRRSSIQSATTIAVKTRPASSFQDFVAPMSPFRHRDCLAVRPPLFVVPPDRPEYLLHSI